jgi:hypothetical protein
MSLLLIVTTGYPDRCFLTGEYTIPVFLSNVIPIRFEYVCRASTPLDGGGHQPPAGRH